MPWPGQLPMQRSSPKWDVARTHHLWGEKELVKLSSDTRSRRIIFVKYVGLSGFTTLSLNSCSCEIGI